MPKKHSGLSLPPAHRFLRLSTLLAGLFLMTAVQGMTLPPAVAAALAEAGIPERSVAIVVRSVDSGNTLAFLKNYLLAKGAKSIRIRAERSRKIRRRSLRAIRNNCLRPMF